jgi:CheY-like chemotaxis protein
MCRGMAKPCVVGSGIRIDERTKSLVLSDGRIIPEGATVAVDAYSGLIEFSDSPDLIPGNFVISHVVRACSERLLQQAWTVTGVRSAEEAQIALRRDDYDVVLLDLMLPPRGNARASICYGGSGPSNPGSRSS